MSNVTPIRPAVAPADSLDGYEGMPPVMSPKVLAEQLEVAVSTLARWRDAGMGPAWHEPAGSRLVRYSRVDVVAWLRSSQERVA